jgi:hypothetical protein
MRTRHEVGASAALVIVVAGIIAWSNDQPSPHATAPPPRVIREVITRTVTHTVTKSGSGWPVTGWQITLIALAAIAVTGGVLIQWIRARWPG